MSSKGNQLGSCLRNGIMAMIMLGVYGMASVAEAQQASLQLKNSDMNFCYRQQSEWTLTKTNDAVNQPVASDTLVTWTVKATKTTSEVNEICAVGYVSVTNGGSAPATIGNIVVNLQRRSGKNWVSASVDVADSTNGDVATSANIVANASQEQAGPTYAVSGAKGTFTENSGSGPLEFTDADSNTIWAITPQQTIPSGATVNLFFKAAFNNTLLNIPAGESLRTEIIVTFGNAGARGGGGASASNIDINGNGNIDADETNVRSVPTRLTRNLPALDKCNDTVQLLDTLSATGASYSNVTDPSGLLTGLAISSTGSYQLSAAVSGTGTVTNTVSLKGTDTFVTVQVPTGQIDPDTGSPVLEPRQIACCTGVDLEASSSVAVQEQVGFRPGDYCTVTQGGYQGGGVPGQAYNNNFIPVFTSPGGMDVGVYNPSNGNAVPNGARWTANAAGLTALKTFLGGGGPSGAITADVLNSTSVSGGALTKQTATLTLTVAFSNGTIWPTGFGALIYNGSDSLNGYTVSQILAAANQALAGSGLPGGYTFSSLNALITTLNTAFDNNHGTKLCEASAWANDHLRKP